MPDDGIATDTAAPVTPTTPPTEAAAPEAAAPEDPEGIARERDALKARLRDQGKLMKELEQLRAAAKEREDAERSELDKATERAAEFERRYLDLEQRHQETNLRLSTVAAAAQVGFRDPQDAVRLLDTSQVEYDDDGSPSNVSKLVSELLRSKPYLAAHQPVPSGQGVRPSNGAEATGVGLADSDIATSMSMKSQRLAQVMHRQR